VERDDFVKPKKTVPHPKGYTIGDAISFSKGRFGPMCEHGISHESRARTFCESHSNKSLYSVPNHSIQFFPGSTWDKGDVTEQAFHSTGTTNATTHTTTNDRNDYSYVDKVQFSDSEAHALSDGEGVIGTGDVDSTAQSESNSAVIRDNDKPTIHATTTQPPPQPPTQRLRIKPQSDEECKPTSEDSEDEDERIERRFLHALANTRSTSTNFLHALGRNPESASTKLANALSSLKSRPPITGDGATPTPPPPMAEPGVPPGRTKACGCCEPRRNRRAQLDLGAAFAGHDAQEHVPEVRGAMAAPADEPLPGETSVGKHPINICEVEPSNQDLLNMLPKVTLIKAALDSGAGDHVASASDLEGLQIQESEGSRRGRNFLAANGERIPNQGEVKVGLRDPVTNGAFQSVFQVAPVSRPLYSVGKICDSGAEVKFTGKKAEVTYNGDILAVFNRDGGLYLADLEVTDQLMGAASDFPRQGVKQ